jgi:hypothetical protein
MVGNEQHGPTYLSSDRDLGNLGFPALDELGALAVEEMKLLGCLAQGHVVLFDEVPRDLVLGEVFIGLGGRRSVGSHGSGV